MYVLDAVSFPGSDEIAGRVKLLDRVVGRVGNVHVAGRRAIGVVNRDEGWGAELAGAGNQLLPAWQSDVQTSLAALPSLTPQPHAARKWPVESNVITRWLPVSAT